MPPAPPGPAPAGRLASLRVDPTHHLDNGGPARIDELDALRGLAALAVVVYHSNTRRLPYGWAAVDLFFVLSGYLITGIILRHGKAPGFLARFYLRRALRVWPAYFLALAGVAASSPFLSRPTDWRGLPYALTFTQGLPLYWSGSAPVFSLYLGHTWTLAVEEQFYLVWPLVVVLAGRRGLVPLAVACAAGSALARGSGLSPTLLGARGDGLALGALLAAALDPGGRWGRDRARLVPGFAALAVVALAALVAVRCAAGPTRGSAIPPWPGLTILGFNALWLGVVGLTACGAGSPRLAPLRHPGLLWLGQVSFGLYLSHFVIMLYTEDLSRALGYRSRPSWLSALTYALCLAAAWASWALVERPALRLKDRFPYRAGQRSGPHSRSLTTTPS